MWPFIAGGNCPVAESSYAAQLQAAVLFKARKSLEVTVVLADVPVDSAGL